MASVVEELRSRVTNQQCITDRCSDAGCSVSLEGVSSSCKTRVIINLERVGAPIDRNRRHCDYLIGYHENETQDWLIALELKKPANLTEIANQIQEVAQQVEEWALNLSQIKFIPVAANAAGRRQEFRERKRMAARITFDRKRVPIEFIRCGDRLAEALNRAGWNTL